jgi:hypothetical protein
MERGGGSGQKRKQLSKHPSRRGRGRGSGPAAPSTADAAAHQQYTTEEEAKELRGHTIPTGGPGTHLHITEFDGSYMQDCVDIFELRAPHDSVQHPIVDYSRSWKGTEEAREMDPYEKAKLLAIDYRFWNVFHSNFYATAILPARKGKICKVQYIDFNELQDKEESEFNTAILTYDRFELSDIMSFRYDWNREILA